MGHNTIVSEAPVALMCRILYYGSEDKRLYLNTGTSLTDYVTLRPRRPCFVIPCREKFKAVNVTYI